MKNTIIVLMITCIFVSCDMGLNHETDIDILLEEIPYYETVKEYENWIYRNIQYKRDIDQYGKIEYWATPQETLINKKGDCEDVNILLMYLALERLGLRGNLIISKVVYENIDMGYHAFALIDDVYYDSTKVVFAPNTTIIILFRYTYQAAMYLANNVL